MEEEASQPRDKENFVLQTLLLFASSVKSTSRITIWHQYWVPKAAKDCYKPVREGEAVFIPLLGIEFTKGAESSTQTNC